MTKKRKNQFDLQAAENSKIPAKRAVENSNSFDAFDNGASTSKQVFDPRKSYANFIKVEPRKLKFLRRRTLVDSAEENDRSGYLSNWYTSVVDNPSFHTLPINCPTAEALVGYSFNGEKEVDRLDRFFQFSKRNDREIEEQVENHRQVQQDLIEAERIFSDLSRNNGRLAAMGLLADQIGWRQIPSLLAKRLYEDNVKQTFDTAQMSNAEIQSLIRHESLDWMDNFDNIPAPGRSILNDIENPRFGPTNPQPISCCIFTKHRNGQISRCLREPIKPFDLTLCSKVAKKLFDFFVWDKKVKVPAVCAFHSSIIDKEPKNTESNPFFERALGKHERIDPVKFTEKSQYEQLAKYIDGALQKEKNEHIEAMSFNLRLLKLLKPPKTSQAMQEIRNRQLIDSGIVRNGKLVDELGECYERAVRRRNELRSTPKCPYKSELSDEEMEDFELPSSTDEWLPKRPNEPGPTSPIFNSFVADKSGLTEDERILYKASEFGLVDMNDSATVEASERYRSLLDVQAYDNDTLRVFGSKNSSIEAPSLHFDAISAASIRRIKKFYNLPNRSGATTKNLLMDGLSDFFANKPVDDIQIARDFIALINERQKAKTDSKNQTLFDTKPVARKARQSKKLQITSELKFESAAETSTSTALPLNNLTVI